MLRKLQHPTEPLYNFYFISGSNVSGSESDVEPDLDVEPRERDGIRRAAAAKAKAKYLDTDRLAKINVRLLI